MSFWRHWKRIFDEMDRIHRYLERGIWEEFDRFWEPRRWRRIYGVEAEGYLRPFVDIMDKPDKIVVVAELSGVPKENITFDATEDSIRVEAKFSEEDREYRRAEGYLYQSTLPTTVKPEEAKAKYRNGVLTVELPKKQARRGFSIPIE